MAAPVFCVPAMALSHLKEGNFFILDGPEGHHAVVVRRINCGEYIELVDGRGARAAGVVHSTTKEQLTLKILMLRKELPEKTALVLVQALAKNGRDEQAIESATELGVDFVIPWQAERSIVRWKNGRTEKALSKWRNIARSAAKQSRRSWIPEVSECITSKALAQRIAATKGLALILDESASKSIVDIQSVSLPEIMLIVGPEGGMSDDERELLSAAGGVAVKLGSEVLRSSTAGPAALAYLSAVTGRWGRVSTEGDCEY